TTAREKQQAEQLAVQWRINFITDAGGSEAVARQRALEEQGISLDRFAEDQYYRFLYLIFLQERVNELSKPSADELRDAYRARVSEFTTPASINFALIEIRPESSSEADIAQAMATAASVRDRATGGEDFAELARDHSDNAAYARRGGALPEMMIPLEKGAYAIAEVEQAAWDTPAGEVGPMLALERNGEQRFYLVKTIEKNERTVRSFQEVQASISNTLRQEKQDAIMEGYFADLQGDLSTPDPETQQRMFETALEIAMQKYDLWRDEAGVESSAGNG
ncbi:MAG: peptidyl-prolyl cis-trans isomerase, partial [Planctomycetota bacterium]